jgi:DNA-directed RNA polymerase subunit RPC12/RpoP
MSTILYRCKRCKEKFIPDEIIIKYIAGKEVKQCPNCGSYGTLVRVIKRKKKITI